MNIEWLATSDYFDIVIRTGLAVILGGLIGLERQHKHRPAGFRTHILVCLGSMTVMIISELMFERYLTEYGHFIDPGRLGAQIISGIGFLGAGTIIHYGANVRGLTTAASLWAVAAIGIAVGSGFYFLAIFVTFMIFFTLFIFQSFSSLLKPKTGHLSLSIDTLDKTEIICQMNVLLHQFNINLLDMEYQANPAPNMSTIPRATLRIHLELPEKNLDNIIIKEIAAISGVEKVEKILI